jgi:hypothetical protein
MQHTNVYSTKDNVVAARLAAAELSQVAAEQEAHQLDVENLAADENRYVDVDKRKDSNAESQTIATHLQHRSPLPSQSRLQVTAMGSYKVSSILLISRGNTNLHTSHSQK